MEGDFFCRVCSRQLIIKNNLLFCESCNIFVGRPETYQKAFNPTLLKDRAPHRAVSRSVSKKEEDSVLFFIYFFIVFFVGIFVLVYFGAIFGIVKIWIS